QAYEFETWLEFRRVLFRSDRAHPSARRVLAPAFRRRGHGRGQPESGSEYAPRPWVSAISCPACWSKIRSITGTMGRPVPSGAQQIGRASCREMEWPGVGVV